MSIINYYDSVEDAAWYALSKTGALSVCARHETVAIRHYDEDAERHAYALATTLLKKDGTMCMREDAMPVIKYLLDMAADEECPECSRIMYDD